MQTNADDTSCPSLMHGVDEAVCTILGIRSLRHRSALLQLELPRHCDLANAVFDQVASNWACGNAAANRDRSKQNWRWVLQTQISPRNKSPEVILERSIATACAKSGRTDWANQIPVASGLVDGASDGRRALDLAHRKAPSKYEMIELKIASDTPLYAAIEVLGYASVWLMARRDPPHPTPELLAAETIDLRVLAPEAYYDRFDLLALERLLDRSVKEIGAQSAVGLSFGFDVLPRSLEPPFLLDENALLDALSQRRPLHGYS